MNVLEIGPNETPNTFERTFYSDLAKMAALNARVFSLRVQGLTTENYEFSTTSGELFMGLGRLGENIRQELAILLSEQFTTATQVLFRFRLEGDEEGKYRSTMYVTKTTKKGLTIFHCSPAH